jgi:hypothetical protein
MTQHEYCLVFSDDEAAKIAAKADEAGFNCDLEWLQERVLEMINIDDSKRLEHTEK